MKIRSARQIGRVSSTVLACALVATAIPASAAGRRIAPSPDQRQRDSFASSLTPADDAFGLAAGETLSIVAPGVLANDASFGPIVPAVVSLVSSPSHGALVLREDGGFDYTPAKGWSGQDTFRYGVTTAEEYGEATVTLSVMAQTDLAVTAAASSPVTAPGSPVTFTFTVLNEGDADADNVELVVRGPVPNTDDATRLQGGAGCMVDGRGTWVCRMGRIASGGSYQVALSLASAEPGTLEASALVTATQPDNDPADNGAAAQVTVGRLYTNGGMVSGRVLWGPGSANTADVEVALFNESPLGLSYEAHATDRTTRDVALDWVTVSPASGHVSALSSQRLTVSLSAAGATPGLKRGQLHFVQDSPFSLEGVPVSFTVAFHDVDAERADDLYVHALAGAGVTAGCRDGFFCPTDSLTRSGSTVWLLLAREGGAYEPAPAEGLFQDVPTDRAEAAFIEELARRGVAGGCDADNFCPDAPLTRADAAVMVLRMVEGVRYNPAAIAGRGLFRDLVGDPRAPWIEDAVKRGLFAACSAGPRFFCPDQPLTRGDAAVSFVKAFDLPLY
jgi:hypothetical protein